jgi:hypothetical protein
MGYERNEDPKLDQVRALLPRFPIIYFQEAIQAADSATHPRPQRV